MPQLASIRLPHEAATRQAAALLAAQITQPATIALSGDLGAGKTCFASGLIPALQANAQPLTVQSPTFNLVQTYPTRYGFECWHVDLYRLQSEAELAPLALDDALEEALLLIEWPERLPQGWLPPDHLWLQLAEPAGSTYRTLSLHGDIQWQPVAALLQQAMNEG